MQSHKYRTLFFHFHVYLMLPLQAESLSVIEEFVRGQLKQIRTNIEIGSDNISARLLTDSANVISKSPTKLFNRSLVTLIFPSLNMEVWKGIRPLKKRRSL